MTYQQEYDALTNQYRVNVQKINALRIPLALKQTLNRQLYNKLNLQIQQLKIKYPVITPPTNTNKSLAIGINYIGTEYELNGCINDVTNVTDVLKNNFNYKENVLMTDNTTIKPIKTNILSQFTKLLQNAKSGDKLFFIFSGHGSQELDTNGDESDGIDEVIITQDFKSILDDDLKKIINAHLKSGVKLFCLFDSCHSGTCFDLKYNENGQINSKMNDTNGQVIFISGCKDEQTSEDAYINNKNNGALTAGFLETLKKYNYLQTNVTYKQFLEDLKQYLSENDFSQIPQLSYGQAMDCERTFFKL